MVSEEWRKRIVAFIFVHICETNYCWFIRLLGDLRLGLKVLNETGLDSGYWIRKKKYLEKDEVSARDYRKCIAGIFIEGECAGRGRRKPCRKGEGEENGNAF